MTEAFVGTIQFRSNAWLEGSFEDEVYLYGNQLGMALSTAPHFAAYNLIQDINREEELAEELAELDADRPWSEMLEDSISEHGAVFSVEEAKEYGLLVEEQVKLALHTYLEERKGYGSYCQEISRYRQGEIEGWRMPAEEEDLVEQLVDYEYCSLDSPEKLVERMELLNSVQEQLG